MTGYDLALAAIKAAAAAGIQPVNSPKAVATTSDLVIVAVGFDSEVEAVMFGDNGLAGRRRRRHDHRHRVHDRAAHDAARSRPPAPAHEIALLDIPLCRGEDAAQAGKLLIMGGGDKEAFDACRPAFAAFANSVFHLGPLGSGEVGKMVNNLILWACISANEEGLKLAREARRRPRGAAHGAARFERRQLVARHPAGGEADAVGGEGHDHRAARRRTPRA